jgi:trans-aconitate methyltransferase
VSDLIGHFDALHAADPDPWQVEIRWYERRKRALTMAALPAERYRSAFEPGCSIGALTELLAARCDALLSVDAAPAAIARAERRVAGARHVTVARARIPEDWPDRRFDLVVLSEVAYYLDAADVGTTVERAVGSIDPGGHLVAVHWREVADDFRTSGAEVHDALAAAPELAALAAYEDADFRLDVFERRG